MIPVARPEQQEIELLVESRRQMRKRAGATATPALALAPRQWYVQAKGLVAFLHALVMASDETGKLSAVEWTLKVGEREFNFTADKAGLLVVEINGTKVLDNSKSGDEEFLPDEWLYALFDELDRRERVAESETIQEEIAAHTAAVSKINQRV
jgi:hypothetical protein